MAEPTEHSDRRLGPLLLRSVLLGLLGTYLVLGLAILGILARSRAFQVDEVEHVHAAYNVRQGLELYEEFHQPHNPLLYYVLWPTIDPADPEESFLGARLLTTALFALNVALCGICAFRLAGLPAAVLASGLALAHTTFVERGLEVRTDGPMSLCVAAALAVELSPMKRMKRYCVEALLLAAAFLFTNKACFACFAFGCLWLAAAWRRRRPALVAAPMAVWTAPLLGALGLMAAAGNLDGFVDVNLGRAVGELARTAAGSPELSSARSGRFLRQEASRNLAFSAIALGGLAVGAAAWFRRGCEGRRHSGLRFTAFLAFVLFATLWIQPFPYPYLHVTALPAFVVLAGVAGARLIARLGLEPHGPGAWAVVLLLSAGAAVQGMPYLAGRSVSFLDHQLATLREIQRVTAPRDAVFDMVGLYFRPDGHRFYNMTGRTLARYRQGPEVSGIPPIPDELERRQVVAVVWSYRLDFLPEEDRAYIERRFVHFDGNVHLLGSPLDVEPGGTLDFEVLKSLAFRYDGEGAILVDGEPFREGLLEKGWHRITRVERRGDDRLVMAAAPPVRWPPRPRRELYDLILSVPAR